MSEVNSELLTLHPSRVQRKQLVDNVLSVYDRASTAARNQGMSWYQTAHDLAGVVGLGDYDKGAGIIAALSANTAWGQNERLALAISEGKEVRHLSKVLDKVHRIMAGEPVLMVLGSGQKTINFFLNIADPEASGAVTVDRHAHDVARGQVWGNKQRGLTTVKRYDVLADAYRDAAALRGVRPHEMQAVTWCQWRDEIAGTSTRGKRVD